MRFVFCATTTRLAKATIGTTVMLRAGTSSQHLTSSSPIFKQTLRGGTMKTVILEVRSPRDSMAGFVNAWKTGRAEKSARIAFASPELLWQVLTAKRWELLKVL